MTVLTLVLGLTDAKTRKIKAFSVFPLMASRLPEAVAAIGGVVDPPGRVLRF